MRDTGIRSLQVLCMASVTYETLGQVHVLQCAVCCMLHVLWCVPYRACCLLLVAVSGSDSELVYSALIFLTISLYCAPLLVASVVQAYTRYI